MTRPSVLLIASFAESVPTFRGALIRAMRDAGMEVDVAVPLIENSPGLQDGLAAHGVTAHGIPLRRTGANPLADLTLVLALYRLIRKLRPTVTLPYTIKPVIYGTIAAWLAGVPRRYALITGLGYAFTDKRRGLLTRIIGMLYRFALGKAHKVFFQNPDDESLFRSRGLLPRSVPSVVVDGSGVDVATFAVVALLSGQPSFLMIGRLLGDKGVREYAEAARRIKARHPAVQFRLAGWIDTNPDAINQAELDDWVVQGTLEFLGKLGDVRAAIADSTVYVLPSYREGTPRTVLEAMAMGRPIITTDAPGCRETVIDGENGYLVPVKSVDALVEAMTRFIDDPDLAHRMGKRSREIAEDRYDVHKINAVMLREMGITPPQERDSHAT